MIKKHIYTILICAFIIFLVIFIGKVCYDYGHANGFLQGIERILLLDTRGNT